MGSKGAWDGTRVKILCHGNINSCRYVRDVKLENIARSCRNLAKLPARNGISQNAISSAVS